MAEGHGRGFTTEILHSDRLGGPIEHGALHKPVHGSVAYGFDTETLPEVETDMQTWDHQPASGEMTLPAYSLLIFVHVG